MRCLALGGGFLLVSLVSPAAGAGAVKDMVRGYIKRNFFERQHFLRDLRHLQRSELIDYRETSDGTVELTITKKGKEKMLRYKLDEMQLKKVARWDRKWRLVIFDVPVDHKQARDAFGRKLISLGFYPLQKSVYITPYPCEDEIEFITSVFDIRRHILILNVSDFEGEEKLFHHFFG